MIMEQYVFFRYLVTRGGTVFISSLSRVSKLFAINIQTMMIFRERSAQEWGFCSSAGSGLIASFTNSKLRNILTHLHCNKDTQKDT